MRGLFPAGDFTLGKRVAEEEFGRERNSKTVALLVSSAFQRI